MKRIACYIIETPLIITGKQITRGPSRIYRACLSKTHATRECAALNVGHWSMPVYTVVECAAWHALAKIA